MRGGCGPGIGCTNRSGRSDRASDEQIVALLRACRSARDRLIVLLMARAGLRRGELCGLRRSDVHLLDDSRALGCQITRAHLHVVRREDNPNGAWAKSRRQRAVPLDFLVVQAFDTYVFERRRLPAAVDSDFVVVNLFREPIGAPMRPDAIGELLAAASRRAGLHAGGHAAPVAARVRQQRRRRGCGIDVVADLLGHASVCSSQVYLHPDPGPVAGRGGPVPSPREQARGDPVTRSPSRRRLNTTAAEAGRFEHVLAGVALAGPAAELAGRLDRGSSPRPAGTRWPGVVAAGRSIRCWAGRCAGAGAARPPRTGSRRRCVPAAAARLTAQGLGGPR